MPISLGIGTAVTRGGGVSWSPLSISGLQFWVDADDSATLYTDSALTTLAVADGDVVGGWKDKSGNSRNALQADGTKKPLLKLAIQNGRNVVRFDATNDLLSLSATVLAFSSCSYFVVWKPFIAATTTGGSGHLFGGNNYGVYTGGNFGGALADERIVFPSDAISANPFYGECTEDVSVSYHLFTITFSRADLAEPFFRRNGAAKTLLSSGTASGIDWETNGNLCLKDIGNKTGEVCKEKEIAELLAYDSSLSNSDILLVETYLKAKWGTP